MAAVINQSISLDQPKWWLFVPNQPGVYQFLNHDTVLYVGKAKRLRYRVHSYVRKTDHAKTLALMAHATHLTITITNNETEALLLEQQWIVHFQPMYNVTFKESKGYPYLWLSDHPYPTLHIRSVIGKKGTYFGPYPIGTALTLALHALRRWFFIRTCSDAAFQNRTNYCNQYQINHCKAPCVQYASWEAYQHHVQRLRQFLKGHVITLIHDVYVAMQHAAQEHNFKRAAWLRDTWRALDGLHHTGSVPSHDTYDCLYAMANMVCHLKISDGRLLSQKNYNMPVNLDEVSCLKAFIASFGLTNVIVSHAIDGTARMAKTPSEIAWMAVAYQNAQQSSEKEPFWKVSLAALSEALQQDVITLDGFDISHFSGDATIGACVTASEQGLIASYHYRLLKGSNDTASLKETLNQHYTMAQKPIPSVILMDGGPAQCAVAKRFMHHALPVIGLSKGFRRQSHYDTLHPASLRTMSPLAKQLLQRIRDEAHRTALRYHRYRLRQHLYLS
jgi:excinuclease ABC subunit C